MQQPVIQPEPVKQFALFELGFRIFFLLACVFSIVLTGLWLANYTFAWPLPLTTITPIAWHGHEMVFGYTVAVIAGFLLTAVRNWTGVQTIKGLPLACLALLWLMARTLPLTNSAELFEWAMVSEMGFFIGLIIAVTHPLVKVKQWKQLIIVALLTLIFAADVLYYLGVYGVVNQGVSWGLFSGVYLIMAVIFILARRVMPFFIERGLGGGIELKNWPLVDSMSLVFLAALWLSDVFFNQIMLVMLCSAVLALLHSIRLFGWYNKGMWKKPLLWVLFFGYKMFIFGFILKAFTSFNWYPTTIPLHAFTYGGIGMVTLGMMARISLGHTGRNINEPPKVLTWIFACLFLGALIRVVVPIFVPTAYLHIIGTAQLLWIIAFTWFLAHYLMIFIRPRADGQAG